MTAFNDYQHISLTRQARVLILTLNRPAQRNAVNVQMHAELARVFTDAQRDEGSDVILLTGAGSAFCAGGDIVWMQQGVDDPAGLSAPGARARTSCSASSTWKNRWSAPSTATPPAWAPAWRCCVMW